MLTQPSNRYSALYGIGFMLINTIALSVLDITAKILRVSLSGAHIVFLYKLILLLAILPWVFNDGLQNIKTTRIHIHLIRSFFSVMGAISFVHGLHYVDMADAAALENIQYILLVIIGMVFFSESVTKTKIVAVLLGFFGAIIVVRPELIHIYALSEEISKIATSNKFYGYTFMAIGFWTLNTVSVKVLGRTEKNKAQMFYLMLFACMWSAPIVFIQWECLIVGDRALTLLGIPLHLNPVGLISLTDINIEWWHLKYLLLMACCYFIHGVAYFKALQHELSIVVPFRYTKLLFSGVLGLLLLAERPALGSYYGYVLIIISGLLLINTEVRKARRLH
ncbi:hypothetical protein EDM53_01070 [Rickettsiales endosymbiont of Peranema trichophorum]|uniref:DMT family transporter n=1 Tax=Rickettsiales endosymbiont of Peranema trichophorum TaxID=2486577 RepID=UPI00102340AD|nr:EamA family transporter [Rickettsiales endosymbiont of Peranema trichophorum]RZI47581.1 hypothetical protein EDM53_01070 [Rickettsiales endosymbiont of Peranema trichophorum]